MFYRMKQFIQGLNAKIFPEDITFLEKYLNEEERSLFFKLRISEQRHSLNVAYGCYETSPKDHLLVKAALLHDIGKIESNLTLINKALVVLSLKFKIKENFLPYFLKKAIYFKYKHPEIGYEILCSLNLDLKILYLVRNHHNINHLEDESMKILKHYDNIY